MTLRLLRAGAGIVAAGLAASVMAIAPAQADTGGITFNLTGIQASDHSVRSGGCHSVPVTATHNAPPSVDDISADVEVWNGSKYIDTISLNDDGAGRLSGEFYYCTFKGFGNFRLGPSEVDWSSYSSDDFLSGKFTDSTSARFAVKQASAMSRPKWSKKGRIATVTAQGKWYSIEDSRWKKDPKGIVSSLQRRPNSASGWKTLKTARSNKKGVVTFKVKPKKRMQYRVVSRETKNAFSGVSPTITKR
jgi:hypothetical protein